MHAFKFPKEVMMDLLPALNSPRRKSEHTIVQFKLQGIALCPIDAQGSVPVLDVEAGLREVSVTQLEWRMRPISIGQGCASCAS